MRKITLTNSRGEKLDVTTTSIFLSDLSGFGHSVTSTTRKIGSRYIVVSKQLDQSSPSGTVVFTPPNQYKKYYEFIRFCSADFLTMKYTPDDTEYRKDCLLKSIDKSEISHSTGALECKVTFESITPWYQEKEIIVTPTADETEGWTWPVTWPVTWSGYTPMTAVMNSDSNELSPAKLTIYGPVKNPSWTVYNNGDVSYTGSVTCEIGYGNKLVIDCTEFPYSITIQNEHGKVVQDVYQKADFSTERFLFMKYGTNAVHVSHEEENSVQIELKARLFYESV